MGPVYLASAVTLNAAFIYGAVRLYGAPKLRMAWNLFRYSIYYLGLLFASMAADRLLPLAF